MQRKLRNVIGKEPARGTKTVFDGGRDAGFILVISRWVGKVNLDDGLIIVVALVNEIDPVAHPTLRALYTSQKSLRKG